MELKATSLLWFAGGILLLLQKSMLADVQFERPKVQNIDQFIPTKTSIDAGCDHSCTLTSVPAETYCVSPIPTDCSCLIEDAPCMTLSQYAAKSPTFWKPNSTLILLPGEHRLDSQFTISNIQQLNVFACASSANVTCSQSGNFTFEGISSVCVSNVTFLGCTGSTVSNLDQFTVANCNFEAQPMNGTSPISSMFIEHSTVTIESTVFNNHLSSTDGGVLSVVDSTVLVDDCQFASNKAEQRGGGAIFAMNSDISTHNSNFEYNCAGYDGGVMFVLNSSITLENTVIQNNSAQNGSGGAINAQTYSNISVINCTFVNNTAIVNGGGISTWSSTTTTINGSRFVSNKATIAIDSNTEMDTLKFIGGGAAHFSNNIVNIDKTTFTGNKGYLGGSVFAAHNLRIKATNCIFANNTRAAHNGGGIFVWNSTMEIESCTFTNNEALHHGGAVYCYSNTNITLDRSLFKNNMAMSNRSYGGALCATNITVHINSTRFISNTAGQYGGAIYVRYSTLITNNTEFTNNTALSYGGALHASSDYWCISGECPPVTFTNTNFSQNTAGSAAAMIIGDTDIYINGYCNVQRNVASHEHLIRIYNCTVIVSGKFTISDNFGDINFLFCSDIKFLGHTIVMNNTNYDTYAYLLNEGTMTAYQSEITFRGTVDFTNNTSTGGTILALESKLNMYKNVTIAHNRAMNSGGGIQAFQSEINFKKTSHVVIERNVAAQDGGGMYVSVTTIKLEEGFLYFINNSAKRGGGIFLTSNAKILLVKVLAECSNCIAQPYETLGLNFTGNSAEYGGAVYVADDTTSGICSDVPFTSHPTTQCFIQIEALQGAQKATTLNVKHVNFTDNTANVVGNTLYGGLLDRCSISSIAEICLKYNIPDILHKIDATQYLTIITNLNASLLSFEISSDPVRVCFCSEGQPDCSLQESTKYVMKGQPFTVSLVAVDQVNNTVSHSTIRSYLSSGKGRLREGQASQHTNESCTELQYNPFSPEHNETLILYAEGPCNNTGISQRFVEVKFNPCECPTGFAPAPSETECKCECDPKLSPFITQCNWHNKTLLRNGDFWMTSVNVSNQSEVFIYPHCPFDYCVSPSKSVYVNLSSPNGEDVQCAFNRSGKLCGFCHGNLSHSLGSSQCIECSYHWLLLLFVFAIAGIALVVFLLVCNLTVAVGTINGLIFYANVVAANSDIFLKFDKPNILTIFIAWINLDFGFQTCFYDGMDGYAKVWLQFVFPIYLLFLVAMVITISEYSFYISKLLSYTKPVWTLAMLILLSYTKLLRTIIAALSFTTLEYPDGSRETVWLYDANVPYLKGKHIPLFIAAVVVLVLGAAYTLLLFFWQWLQRCPNIMIFKWTSNTRLHHFMRPYNAPYNDQHRYWTGLLLFARVLLYVISSLNHVIGDARVNLLSVICVVGSVHLLKEIVVQRIYKLWFISVLNSSFIFNLVMFSAATLYVREINGNQAVLAYTSTGIAFITFLGILAYHSLTSKLMKKPMKKIRVIVASMISWKRDDIDDIITDSTVHTLRTDYGSTGNSDVRVLLTNNASVTEIDGLPPRTN